MTQQRIFFNASLFKGELINASIIANNKGIFKLAVKSVEYVKYV